MQQELVFHDIPVRFLALVVSLYDEGDLIRNIVPRLVEEKAALIWLLRTQSN